ncbi:MAG: hypothetical protein JO300_09260 [Silvibacterium sp.]|nr:hypothetical protein [Silvibacterium sp.]
MTLRVLIRRALFASVYGWIAGLVASLPFQATEAIRASGSIADAAFAILLWTLFSFLVSLYFCAFFVIPIGWMLPSSLILRHRLLSIVAAGLFGAFNAAVRLHIWTARYHDGISPFNFYMWAAFSGAFFLTASMVYTRSLTQHVWRAKH